MGGYGSGRRGYRIISEHTLGLSIKELTKRDLLQPGFFLTWTWHMPATQFREARKTGEINIMPDIDKISLSYQKDENSYSYPISLDWTPCYFGRQRPWFLYPGCGRRVGKLFLPSKASIFKCRHCYNLTYCSSNQSGNDIARIWRKIRKIQNKLDINDNEYPVSKPKNMHKKTFYRLRQAYDQAHEEKESVLLENFKSFIGKSKIFD